METATDFYSLHKGGRLDQTPVTDYSSPAARDICDLFNFGFGEDQTVSTLKLRSIEVQIEEALAWNLRDLRNWPIAKGQFAGDEINAKSSLSRAALDAVKDIQEWLLIGQDEVAILANYAPRSVKNWRDGMEPYPATVRHLFDLHALVGSLINAKGADEGRVWLINRRDRITSEGGLREVISEASSMLFNPPSVTPFHLLEFEEETPPAVVQRPELFDGPVRRARRHP